MPKIKNTHGFTLIEVILTLVILGILATVAIPKFFDMQERSRLKALNSCIAVLNGQANVSFANNIMNIGFNGGYDGYVGSGDPDFVITGQTPNTPATGTIKYKNHADIFELVWIPGPAAGPDANMIPGFFTLGNKI